MSRVFGRASSRRSKRRGPTPAGWQDGVPILQNDNDIPPAKDAEFHSGKASGYRQAIPYAPVKPITQDEMEKLRRIHAPLRGRRKVWSGFTPER